MKRPLFISLFLALACAAAENTSGQVLTPEWSPTFTVEGTISLPYAEIEEPFTAFYNEHKNKSRIDYYGGMDKTFQLGDVGEFGASFKIVPMTNEHIQNQINCFAVNSTAEENRVRPQSVLPDLNGFQFKGLVQRQGQEVEKWQKKETIGGKYNKYTIWLKTIRSDVNPEMGLAFPVYYEMKGYNSLLGSHYDHYFIEYEAFSPDAPNDDVFDVGLAVSTKCHDWPGPGMDHTYTMNPMREFVSGHARHVDEAFDRFKARHGKTYRDDADHDVRKDIFRQNKRFIHAKNRQGLTYTLAENHMTDWTHGEMKAIRGKLYSGPGPNGGLPFEYTQRQLQEAPEALDWRLYGAVSQVKDQAICGSCWSFGTVGALEAALFMKSGELTRLSQQALVDCSWGEGNNGCDGGEDFRAYSWMLKNGGIPTEDSYGPYLGADGYCHAKDATVGLAISGWVNVTSGDLDALTVAVAKHGPVSVAIDASHKSLSFYSRGVYYEPKCSNSEDGLDHCVLAVGYGEQGGQKYWLVKNSWSNYWGNDGYVLMSQKDNNCGVATSPTYVIPK